MAHPEYPNNKANLAIKNIKESYTEMEPMVSILILYNNKWNRIIVVYINRI